jgi:GntR family transcriptional regulator
MSMLSARPIPSGNRLWTRPLYLQLRDALAERIASGEWKPGVTIPNEGDLAREFGVSAGTMRKALDLMEGDRLLTRRQGRGTFVNDQASQELALRFCNVRLPTGERVADTVQALEITEGSANPVESRRLGLGNDDAVFRMTRVRLRKEQAYMAETVVLPAALFPGLPEDRTVSPRIIALCQKYGILLGKAEERVSLGSATPAVAKTLGIPAATSTLVLDRVVLALDGRPVEWRTAHCHLQDMHYLSEMS